MRLRAVSPERRFLHVNAARCSKKAANLRLLCTMYNTNATIEDVYRLALPPETRLMAGRDFLSRQVSWACSLRPSPPAFPKLDGNELALIDMNDLRQLDPKMLLERVVRSLEGARVAAVAVQGDVSRAAVDAAQTSKLALFQLPSGVPLIQVERAVIRLIVDRSGYIAQRSAELQRELNQIALDGGGVTKIVNHLHAFALQPVLLLREDGAPVAYSGLAEMTDIERQHLFSELPNIVALRSWAATHPSASSGSGVGVMPLQDGAASKSGVGEVVVAPVVAGESVRGYCLVLRTAPASGQQLSAAEEMAAAQGAAAAALEWAKQNAVDVAEERMRATFLDELLASEVADEQAWIQRGASLGYDLNRPHVAWFIEAANVPEWPAPLLQYVDRMDVHAPYSRREQGILLFWPVDNPASGRELKAVAGNLVAQVTAKAPQAKFVMGIGRPAVGPSRWLKSQQQARECWRLGKEWKGAPITYFGDLGLYQLLTALGGSPEAARFFRKTLGKLVSHDGDKNAELVDTLEAFFACHGNLSQTAGLLHIHRNTLAYRLERIAEITQLDLDDADARFSLQLALKLRPIVK